MTEVYFNIDNGYLEGLVRGFKSGILKQSDYLNLVQCETLEGEMRLTDVTVFTLFTVYGTGDTVCITYLDLYLIVDITHFHIWPICFTGWSFITL